jgi:L-aspartate oxidase
MAGARDGLVIVGSGISGLFVALEASRAGLGPVTVLTKASVEECNTRWAQGGIAAAVGEMDSPALHLADTLEAGAGLVDETAARILCEEAPARIRDLVQHGVAFDSYEGGVALGREAAHSQSRILHAGGDQTGAGIATALVEAAIEADIRILDYTLVTAILHDDSGAYGVEAFDLRTGARETYPASAVVLATGGAGQIFQYTTNPPVATADGVALAFAAGAELQDLEVYQFHPTALRLPATRPFLISEAVRGEGAVLRNAAGEAFMPRYDERADLAPRDIVARAIVHEMRRAGTDHVMLDCSPFIDSVDPATRFPSIYATCRAAGIDMRTDLIPVAPAAHYLMGGVRTDTWGRTTLPGLYACGEVACTGVHGANRLASNSLMETVVFGKRIVEHLAGGGGGQAAATGDAIELTPPSTMLERDELQRLMWDACGIERDGDAMQDALDTIAGGTPIESAPPTRMGTEECQMTTVGWLMLSLALRRTESRGAHYRTDYPERDDADWRRHQVVVHGR